MLYCVRLFAVMGWSVWCGTVLCIVVLVCGAMLYCVGHIMFCRSVSGV